MALRFTYLETEKTHDFSRDWLCLGWEQQFRPWPLFCYLNSYGPAAAQFYLPGFSLT